MTPRQEMRYRNPLAPCTARDMRSCVIVGAFFFFNDTATTEIYTLSLHDALPISNASSTSRASPSDSHESECRHRDRKSTRLNSSHPSISYAVFCLKKKKKPF